MMLSISKQALQTPEVPSCSSHWARHFVKFASAVVVTCLAAGCASLGNTKPQPAQTNQASVCNIDNTITAEVVALEQAYVLNRFGAYVPAGMMYALKRDVVAIDGKAPGPGNAKLRDNKRPRPLVLRVHEGGCLQVKLHNWLAKAWEDEGGQPPYPTIQMPDGSTVPAAPAHLVDAAHTPSSRKLKPLSQSEKDAPRTRHVSLFVTGLEADRMAESECPIDAVCGGDGTYVGLTAQQGTVFNNATSDAMKRRYQTGSLIEPGGVSVIRWIARREGTFFAHSMGAPVGGEGDGGQIGLGLFAAVNVEPAGSSWYRSQLTHEEMQSALKQAKPDDHPYEHLNYEYTANGTPVLKLTQGKEIVHSDLNAMIVRTEAQQKACTERLKDTMVDGQRCEPAFREFTVILHDEVHAQQAFPELEEESHPLFYLKDGMGINYGVSSMGSLALAAGPQRGVGPAAKCPECRAEEFFLSSWANGDPALVLQWDAKGEKPIGARYPDDPSNVHHSYLGDPVVFRNLHAGPKETHVFHLHAHQWVLDASDPNSTYLDSQTISPGATFSYGIEFGGSGNRNFTPGDSIFHCHLYPHFAQGMWELWRVHDVFENGLHKGLFDSKKPAGDDNHPQSRSLPDGEVEKGIANPAIVPLPGIALAPMPSAKFRGYPFYIPGEKGHRPPQPVLDMDVNNVAYNQQQPGQAYETEPAEGDVVNGGLKRHVIKSGTLKSLSKITQQLEKQTLSVAERVALEKERDEVRITALSKGGEAAQVIAQKIYKDHSLAFEALAADWDKLELQFLDHSGTPDEKNAMQFHEGKLQDTTLSLAQGRLENVEVMTQPRPNWWTHSSGYKTARAQTVPGMSNEIQIGPAIFHVNGRGRAPGSPYANPCPEGAPHRNYKASFIQTEITVNKHGWFDPQGRIVILEDDIKDVIDANTRTKLPEPLFFRANSGDCINFKSSNFIPSALNADDFQIYTPTDTIGQHIHLVKFDVTSSDGSGNGWNYEDSTFSPDEVRERILAHNRTNPGNPLKMKEHPLFKAGGTIFYAKSDPATSQLYEKGRCDDPQKPGETDHAYLQRLSKDRPYCGAQRTTQRWWADPILVRGGPKAGKDNTLRTVFTHDHMGPSSHQQHGLYAALVIEPANSVWRTNPFDIAGDASKLEADIAKLQSVAVCAGLSVKPQAPGGTAFDNAVQLAFAVRATSACDANAKTLAEAVLTRTLLGGSDLVLAPVKLEGKGDFQLKEIKPRPAWQSRADGGPTSTRATIVSPRCIGDENSSAASPGVARNCDEKHPEANQSRREFGLAFADFAGVYNVGLEPINPETPRDVSMRRFGERQVAIRPARPIAISSEDPGTQLVNYRHEPLALRVAQVKWSPLLGGFDYSQSNKRIDGGDCVPGAWDCLGDLANGFSSFVHSKRDLDLATQSYVKWVSAQSETPTDDVLALSSPALKQLAPVGSPRAAWIPRLKTVLNQVEAWRQDFNCALYMPEQWQDSTHASSMAFKEACKTHRVKAQEPWRVFGDPATPILAAREGDPVQIRLIQGAQEAQHVFTMNGVKWHRLPDSPNSGFVNAQPLGISEHFEFDVRVPKFELPHADYLYFGSSIDQLWDGMWGVLRAYQASNLAAGNAPKLASGQSIKAKPDKWFPAVPQAITTPVAQDDDGDYAACLQSRNRETDKISVKSFEVSAVRACDLTQSCDKAGNLGISYSKRHDISDPLGVVYVLTQEAKTCEILGSDLSNAAVENQCYVPQDKPSMRSNSQVLRALQLQFTSGRQIEPLVLRAAAGECISVRLRNHLPQQSPVMAKKATPAEKDAYHNFLPMIADGFNLNQIQMSNTVGLSAPRVTLNPVSDDGSNVGLNSAALHTPFNNRPQAPHKQGSLVAPCTQAQSDSVTLDDRDRCSKTYVWSATDLKQRLPRSNEIKSDSDRSTPRVFNDPVEFGALPLRSFGDAVKHPVHGLVGALIIGPAGSAVCEDDKRSYPGGVSRQVCTPGREPYGDHVLVMQDAVSAVQGGFPVPDLKGAEEPDDYGVKAINYKTEPLWARRGGSPSVEFGERSTNFDYSTVFSSKKQGDTCESGVKPNGTGDEACDPETSVMKAKAGTPQRLHFVHAGGHTRQQGLTISGHGFHPYPWKNDSTELDQQRCWPAPNAPTPEGCLLWQGVFNGFGPMMGQTLTLRAGGTSAVVKDYLVRTQASFLLDGGLWGLLRVTP